MLGETADVLDKLKLQKNVQSQTQFDKASQQEQQPMSQETMMSLSNKNQQKMMTTAQNKNTAFLR